MNYPELGTPAEEPMIRWHELYWQYGIHKRSFSNKIAAALFLCYNCIALYLDILLYYISVFLSVWA